VDESLYFSVHSASARLAPDGQTLIHTAVYLHESEHGGDDHKERLHKLLDLVQPGWRDELVYERFLPNMTTSFGMATAVLGGANGLAQTRLPLANDADNAGSTMGQSNIYVAGDWVGSGYLLADAAVDSALKASTMVLQNVQTAAKSKVEQNLVTK